MDWCFLDEIVSRDHKTTIIKQDFQRPWQCLAGSPRRSFRPRCPSLALVYSSSREGICYYESQDVRQAPRTKAISEPSYSRVNLSYKHKNSQQYILFAPNTVRLLRLSVLLIPSPFISNLSDGMLYKTLLPAIDSTSSQQQIEHLL